NPQPRLGRRGRRVTHLGRVRDPRAHLGRAGHRQRTRPRPGSGQRRARGHLEPGRHRLAVLDRHRRHPRHVDAHRDRPRPGHHPTRADPRRPAPEPHPHRPRPEPRPGGPPMSVAPFDSLFDPDAREDWAWNWASRLQPGETIASHVIEPTAVTVVSSSVDGTYVRMRAEKPERGAKATCRITTSTGRILDWTMTWVVADR